jgi:hypothetical protein
MNNKFHIIPGWEDTCNDAKYPDLAKKVESMGYEVICHNVDWKQPLSEQVFSTSKEDVIFGISLGAILGWLVAQEHPCKHLILASMTPHYSFTDPEIKKALVDLAGSPFVEDIIKHLKTKHQAEKQTVMYGDTEGEKADVLVPQTDHEFNENYADEVSKLLLV